MEFDEKRKTLMIRITTQETWSCNKVSKMEFFIESLTMLILSSRTITSSPLPPLQSISSSLTSFSLGALDTSTLLISYANWVDFRKKKNAFMISLTRIWWFHARYIHKVQPYDITSRFSWDRGTKNKENPLIIRFFSLSCRVSSR